MRMVSALLLSLLLVALQLLTVGAVSAEPRLVRACDNDQDYPPFRWRETGADGQLEIKGLGQALLRHILTKHGWRLEIDLLPLRRCLQEVAQGRHYQLLINSSPNPERVRTYLLTEPFAYVHFHSFYLQRRFPERSPVQSKQDLQQLRVCGLAGHNFSMFGLSAEQLHTEAESFPAVFQLLRNERCDVLPYNVETIKGFRLLGQDLLANGEFAHSPIPDVPRSPLLMLIAKPYRYGDALREMINTELAAMRASGELEQFQQQYQLDTPAAPAVTPAEPATVKPITAKSALPESKTKLPEPDSNRAQ